MKMIMLETERLVLRNYTMNDIPAVHDYFSNEDVARYEDFYPMTMEEVKKELTEWKDMDNRMAVQLKESGELIGSVGYWVDDNGKYSIDYDFNPKFQNKGYATEAAKEVIRHLTEDLHIKEIYGDCDERNTDSSNLLLRLGFKKIYKNENASYKNDAAGNSIIITVNVYQYKV